jgi:hypothetical protein
MNNFRKISDFHLEARTIAASRTSESSRISCVGRAIEASGTGSRAGAHSKTRGVTVITRKTRRSFSTAAKEATNIDKDKMQVSKVRNWILHRMNIEYLRFTYKLSCSSSRGRTNGVVTVTYRRWHRRAFRAVKCCKYFTRNTNVT